jgi:hypothetical protein
MITGILFYLAGADTLTAFVLSLCSFVLTLLSFYLAKSAIDYEGFIKVWRIASALVLFAAAHIPAYLSLGYWGL